MSEDRVTDALNAFYGKDFGQYHSELREAMACLLAHGTPAPAAQGDWVMVPRKMTPEMDAVWLEGDFGEPQDCWDAMLAAAPSAVEDAVKAERDWLDAAASLYDRCKLFPESSEDGMVALLELRSLVLAAIRARKP